MQDEQFKAGEQLGKIASSVDSLKSDINDLKVSFHDFKVGIGEKVGEHQDSITELKTKTGIIMTVGSWILAPAITVIVTGLIYLLLKR